MEKLPRVIICVTNDLVTDQRVDKVANTLLLNGFEPVLVGRVLNNSKSVDRTYKTIRFNLLFNTGALFYANYNLRLFLKLLFSKVDIILSNDLDSLFACFWASKIRRKKLVYDSHELFSEVPELIGRDFQRNTWIRIEKFILPKLKNTYTVCGSIAKYYNEKYGVSFKVVRNLPKRNKINVEKKDGKYIIYQGALNVGRGIELMIEAMQYITDYRLVIAGGGDIESKLKNYVSELNLDKVVSFSGRVEPQNLQAITAAASLGLSLEEDMGLNYRYALPNKLFDYIQVNIPVIVSDLPEMRQIVNEFEVGAVLKDRTAQGLANLINEILSNYEYVEKLKGNAKKASEQLCWENEEATLLEAFK